MNGALASRGWAWIFTLLALLATLFPIYWVATISMKTELDAFAIPPVWFFTPIWENYIKIWHNEFLRDSFVNSICVTAIAVTLSLVIAVPAAWYTFSASGLSPLWAMTAGLYVASIITFLAMLGPMLRTGAHVAAALVAVACALIFAFVPYNLGLILAGIAGMMTGARVELWMEKQGVS